MIAFNLIGHRKGHGLMKCLKNCMGIIIDGLNKGLLTFLKGALDRFHCWKTFFLIVKTFFDFEKLLRWPISATIVLCPKT